MLVSNDTKEHNFKEVNHGQKKTYKQTNEWTGLDYAIKIGHSEIVQLIKQHGEACGIPPPDDQPDFYSTN